ncbi:8987_t:CDS:2 [Cetraspora pellucida]|uniref:8987_t:CDS:1 n=1 Tax=Cetraspora pellucida TaxID=1433469 RepID=A0A9N9ISX8_9GLOM|nr:8987_t:CDS:2 [Cetraspora pellucida]
MFQEIIPKNSDFFMMDSYWKYLQKSNLDELSLPNFTEESTVSQENIIYERYKFDDKPVEPCEIRPEPQEFEDLTKGLVNFLDVWVEISAEKVKEINKSDDDNDNKMPSEIENIIYPAVDPATKWDLKSLFNNLQLP